jgi:hypothetical protein
MHTKPFSPFCAADQYFRRVEQIPLRQHGLTYGVIYKGSYLDHTDHQYIASAMQHINEWRDTIKEAPDHVLFQNWERLPINVLPETSPTTLTYLINWYCEHTNVPGGCR